MKHEDDVTPALAAPDRFPEELEISFVDGGQRQTLVYRKVTWPVLGGQAGLRYGENEGHPAALYQLTNGNLVIGDVQLIGPHPHVASAPELVQRGKHPSKIGVRDVDIALGVFRYSLTRPSCVIVKHNNPCGAAIKDSLEEAFWAALLANRVGARGGCAALNRAVDKATAEAILHAELDIVVAPDFEPGVLERLKRQPGLTLLRIGAIEKLEQWIGRPYLEFTSLLDGGVIAQWAVTPRALTRDDCSPAKAVAGGLEQRCRRQPNADEWDDLLFAWKIAAATISDSLVFVKDGVTAAIGIGGQDRTTVTQTTRDEAYHKLADRLAWERFKRPFTDLHDEGMRASIWDDTRELKGGLIGASLASDGAFFEAGAVEVALAEGVAAIIQPGGAATDATIIEQCNAHHAAMVFTGRRIFRH
jgi:phosphoribosylaminoimidazolecarboxamide formyltransferase / IMP cyclohydrolase